MRAPAQILASLLLVSATGMTLAATVVAGTGDTAAGGHNTTVPYTFNIGPYNAFNPALGGLRDIDFSLQTHLLGHVDVTTSSTNTFQVQEAAQFLAYYPNTATSFLTDSSAQGSNSPTLGPGTSIVLVDGNATPDYSTSTLDPISKYDLMSAFVGTGTYTLPVNATTLGAVSPTPSGGFTSGGAARAVITVTYTYGAASNTAVGALTAIYSASAQNGVLRATITSGGSAVSSGVVYFVLTDSSSAQVGTTVIGVPTTAGVAAANFTLPAGQALGNYTLTATYDGGNSYGLSQGSAPFYIRTDEIFASGFGAAGGH